MIVGGAFAIPASHPSLPGHFPGRPVVPGVVVLDHALAVVARHHAGLRLHAIDMVKFARALLPEELVQVEYMLHPGGSLHIQAQTAGGLVMQGRLQVSCPDPA